METKNFNLKIAQLNKQVGKLDQAVETEIFYGNKKKPQEAEKWKGIFNLGTEKLAVITSNQYQIIQHNDVLKSVVEVLNNLNIKVIAKLDNYRDYFKADIIFTNKGKPVNDHEEGIMLGMRVMNSYNKSSSFRLEMMGFRLVCQNGMVLGRTMEVRNITFHVGKEKTINKIEEVTESFIKDCINSSDKLQAYVNECIGDSIEWSLCKTITEKLIDVKKHRDNILAKVGELDSINRWDLYNAITSYITHNKQLKPSIQDWLELKSQKVLTTNFKALEQELVIENNNEVDEEGDEK